MMRDHGEAKGETMWEIDDHGALVPSTITRADMYAWAQAGMPGAITARVVRGQPLPRLRLE